MIDKREHDILMAFVKAASECAIAYALLQSNSQIAACANIWKDDLMNELNGLDARTACKVIDHACKAHRLERDRFPRVCELKDRIYDARRKLHTDKPLGLKILEENIYNSNPAPIKETK